MRRAAVGGATALILMLAQACWAADQPPPSPQAAKGFSVSIPNSPTAPVSYIVNGQSYSSLSSALDQVQSDMDADLDKVKVIPVQVPGRLRIVHPTIDAIRGQHSSGYQGRREATDAFSSYESLLNETQVKALKKSQMFTEIVVERKDVAIPSLGSFDYVLWKDGSTWYMADKVNPGQHRVMPFNTGRAVGFVGGVSSLLGVLNDPKGADVLRTFFLGGAPIFEFRGVEYRNVNALSESMLTYFVGKAKATKPVPDRLCGKAKLVVASQRQLWRPLRPANAPEVEKIADQGQRAYYFVLNFAKATALQESKLFDSINITVADQEDIPMDGYDWVIWQRPSTGTWRFRGGSGDAYNLVGNPSTGEDWVKAVQAQLKEQFSPANCRDFN